MREIKFRAWNGKGMVMNPISPMSPDFPMNDLMQFTGLNLHHDVTLSGGD